LRIEILHGVAYVVFVQGSVRWGVVAIWRGYCHDIFCRGNGKEKGRCEVKMKKEGKGEVKRREIEKGKRGSEQMKLDKAVDSFFGGRA
jgi:hypothetical protein